ncbi:probable RNA methyltransferase CG11342 [Plutella xylostella]|uniref:probable RNA methyltransferase CG11342 n=1 Tax=Plutella xylostella TaxID=51655 RepID=UPI002032B017|nr:probable RNA methyltransferase CG11342 [Plutella xylostella]XP_037977193.2 probable RNA methyltransferase CG11342 [Plutella xylostella]XP_037977194.2 probable RNA methyltransferase CG11342 [Plutella xylostella]XP_037977196.2 probable RNA methyltransferase CG11342 [Plutella xylostella]XP_037977197.2 probable RNA methyltransferase CG11342 [Plutella xylostella]XP_037977198.2 probable RNA methyltransferase CG11342 [Plutella xylostella]XP_037977200.2 probable RNA methyltransferase CG11342 [Plut
MKPDDDLSFIGGDPGAVKHGNFINYYSFHSAKERINNLSIEMFPTVVTNEPIICLDIGCNSGELTQEFYQYLKNVYHNNNIMILAIDIDSALIKRAIDTNTADNITFRSIDIMSEDGAEEIKTYLNSHSKQAFDITFCFSVTMWIHLNNGDEGLLKFLQFLKEIPSTVLIETQPWNCYRNAQRRMKKQGNDFAFYHTLKIRSDVNLTIEKVMIESTHKKVYESHESAWKRRIQSFQLIK